MTIGGGKNHNLVFGNGGIEVGSFDPWNHNSTFIYSLDMPSMDNPGPESVSVYFLPVSISGPDETCLTNIKGLLVEPADDDLTALRRVWIMSCHGTKYLQILHTRAFEAGGTDEENAGFTAQ